MKKLSIILANILLLSILFVISGCSPNNSTSIGAQAGQKSGYVAVTNPGGNVSISVPSDWNANDRSLFPGSIIAVGDVTNHEYLIVTAEPKTRLGANSTIDDLMTQIKTYFARNLVNAVWGNSSSVTIGGLKGLTAQVTWTNESSDTSTTYFVYALANNNYYYDVTGATNTRFTDANEVTLQKIIYSFKAPVTTVAGSWRPYAFPGSVILSFILLIVGIGLVFLATRMKTSLNVPHPGKSFKITIIVTWVVLILIFLFLYLVSEKRTVRAIQNGPIFPITMVCAVLTFAYVAYISRRDGLLAALGNGIMGAAAGPMVFEFPFDWIVIHQANASFKYLLGFFTALFVIELSTFSLLLLSKRVSITRYSMYSLGAMFIVFAVWALEGFSYPSSPVPFLLNAISKILSFTTIIALFSIGLKQVTNTEIKKSID